MKKLFIIAASLLVSTVAIAQQSTEKGAQAVAKKIEKSDATIADAKKAANAAVWIDRANLMIDAANAYTSQLFPGMPIAQLLIPTALGKPQSIESVEVMGVGTLDKYVFEKFDVYATSDQDAMIQFWETKTPIHPDVFGEALNSLKKAKELSAKDFTKTGRGVQAADRYIKECITIGGGLYSLGKYAVAGKMFFDAFQVSELKGATDTTFLLNSGICYFTGNEPKTALQKFEQLLSYGSTQNGMTYKHIADCYSKLNDKEKAIENYNKAFDINPSNLEIIGGMIDAYIASDKNPEMIIDLLKKAQELSPKNAILYQVEGDIWNKIGNRQNAIAAALKAQELDPQSFAAFYNEAIYLLLESDDLVEKSNKLDINDTKNYNEMMDKVKDARLKAVVALEKAYQIDPASEDVISVLPQIYFICRDYSGDMQKKYDDFVAKHPQK